MSKPIESGLCRKKPSICQIQNQETFFKMFFLALQNNLYIAINKMRIFIAI